MDSLNYCTCLVFIKSKTFVDWLFLYHLINQIRYLLPIQGLSDSRRAMNYILAGSRNPTNKRTLISRYNR